MIYAFDEQGATFGSCQGTTRCGVSQEFTKLIWFAEASGTHFDERRGCTNAPLVDRTGYVLPTTSARPDQQHGIVRSCDPTRLIDDRLHLRARGDDTIIAPTAGRLSDVSRDPGSPIESRSGRCRGFDAVGAKR